MTDKLNKYLLLLKKYYIIVLFLIGLLLIFLSSIPKSEQTLSNSEYTQALENKISNVVSLIDGAGECAVIINIGLTTENVTGVTVICDGGDNIKVKNSIINAVSTLLGIGTNNVCVIAKAN